MTTALIGYDGSAEGHDALALGAALAAGLGIRLVVAVVDELNVFSDEPLVTPERSRQLDAVLDDAPEVLGERDFTRVSIWGSVPECLDLIATEQEADLIIVGSTSRGPLGRVTPGSVGDRLLTGAPCSVAVAPRGYADRDERRLERIGVGVDGEDESRAALRLADEIAAAAGGSLALIAVIPQLVELMPGRISHTLPGYEEALRDHLTARLADAASTCTTEGEIEQVLAEGDAAEVLVARSESLDLLLLGSRGYGPLRRVLLGGVASEVMRRASCPVVVTPRSAARSRLEIIRGAGEASNQA